MKLSMGKVTTAFSLFLLVVFIGFARGTVASNTTLKIKPESLEAFQGGIVTVRVSGSQLDGVRAIRNGVVIPFFPTSSGDFQALLGVDLAEKPGPSEIVIRSSGQPPMQVPMRFNVKKQEFPTERFSVAKAFDTFDEATLKRIRREQGRMKSLWSRTSGRRWWQGPFVAPVPGGPTSAFGRRRIINGSPRSPHSGVDLRAALGDPIVAPNHGKVVLVDEFYFNGKSIVLDHGWGLYTMYFHLSEFRVKEGQEVNRGEIIGLAGMTGRVTGPHLHWGARLNRARVDPLELLNRETDEP